MIKVYKVKGMNCRHCEMRIKKAIEEIDAVQNCNANHNTGEIVLTLMNEVNVEIIRQKLQTEGFNLELL